MEYREKNIRNIWDMMKDFVKMSVESQKEKRQEMCQETYLKRH